MIQITSMALMKPSIKKIVNYIIKAVEGEQLIAKNFNNAKVFKYERK